MDAAKKEARALAKLMDMLGVDVPVPTGPTHKQQKMTTSREAEAVIQYAKSPNLFTEKTCSCGKRFAVNRGNVGSCSDVCRARELEAIGIAWDWSKRPELRWSVRYQNDELTNEPLIVPEEAIDIVSQVLGRQALPRDESVNV